MNQKTPISREIKENYSWYQKFFEDASDIKIVPFSDSFGDSMKGFFAYIEVVAGSFSAEDSVFGAFLQKLSKTPKEKVENLCQWNYHGLSDAPPIETLEESTQFLLTGDVILFVDGWNKAVKVPAVGYPGMAVSESDSEKIVRGSNEGFCDNIKINTALMRKRVRSTRMKVKLKQIGLRSHTMVNLVYMEDLVKPTVLAEIERRLDLYEMDAVMDSGIIEQLSEEKWYSPFPQFQTTQRPDRASLAVLEGRVVLLVNNSPVALLLPTDFNSFLSTVDDQYNGFWVASFARIIRYLATFFALTLPGLYLAVTNFHTQILPTPLLLSFWEARQGVPFPSALEVLLMELSFELLREAGIRLPGAMGNTIGIVGGLIIGQAAVDANLVSPIVVILVAFTALCSFAIPNEEFAFAFRLLKFFMLGICAWLGFFGFLVGCLLVLVHLAGLSSFGVLYLNPFVGPEENIHESKKDAIFRFPMKFLKKRPIYAREEEKIKLKEKRKS